MKELTINPRRAWILVFAILAVAIVVRIVYGFAKTDYHVDEAITLALTNETWLPPVDTGVFGKWMGKQELEDRAFNDAIRQRGFLDFVGIAQSTARDVHPPLYYWLFAGARLIVGPQRHMAANLLLNLACFILSSAFLLIVMRRVSGDSRLSLIVLALFAFSSAAVSESLFLRMYELLQTDCMAFLCCATVLLYPKDSRYPVMERVVAYTGLFLSACAGLLTHYYFLLFIAPVSFAALIALIRRKDFPALLWAMLSVLAGLYLAYRVFPDMASHMTGSQRARQSIGNLTQADLAMRLRTVGAYILLLVRYVPAFVAFLVALALRPFFHRDGSGGVSAGFIALLALTFCVLFLTIALSAPYQTLRYIVSFTPAFVLLFAALVVWLLPGAPGRVVLVVALILGVVPGLIPGNIADFHEDYRVDKNPAYFADDVPVIVVSSYEGASWKNLLLYKSIPAQKRVFVASRGAGDLSTALLQLAAKSGSREVYVFSDDWFPRPPEFERVGYYGFFCVYRLTVE